MPANMMNAALGLTLYVTGSSSATVIAGPIPGSTPTAVPNSTPITAYIRFIGVAASAKPCSSQLKLSMSENPVQNACRQRDSEPGIERVETADRQHDADQKIEDVSLAAENRCGPGEQQGPGDRPAQRHHEHDHGHEQPDEQSNRAPVGRRASVDVLSPFLLAGRAARNRDGQDDRQHDQADADDDREHARAHRIHLRETRLQGQRVVDQECADRDQHRAYQVLRLVYRLLDRTVLSFGGAHTSPNSVRVDETRLSWSFRNCSNCAPVTNASVQPFFTSASFHCCVACNSSSTFTIACLASSEMPGGARIPRQLAKVRSIPASFRVGASMPSIRSSLDTASTRNWPASIWSMNSPGLDVPTVIFLPSSAVSRSPPPS